MIFAESSVFIIIIAVFGILGLTYSQLAFITAQNEPSISILSHSSFINTIGSLHVVGEVENDSPSMAAFVKVVGTFYDQSGRVVGTAFTFTDPPDLITGYVAPFDLTLSSASVPIESVDHYRLAVTWQEVNGENNVITRSTPTSEGTVGKETIGQSTMNPCEHEVEGNFNLTSDLDCIDNGIIVTGNDTAIRLNGYSIRGSGTESSTVGIIVEDKDNVTIEGPGAVSNFQAGILLHGSDMTKISSAILSDNQYGVFMTGAENAQVEQNILERNDVGVTSNSSTATTIYGNLMAGNLLAGITFVNTNNSEIDNTNIAGSKNGMFLDGQSFNNTVEANNVLGNVIDINNANGSAPLENDNKYLANNCQVSMPSEICIGR